MSTSKPAKVSSKGKENEELKTKRICPIPECGLKGTKKCGQCGLIYYCSTEHQVLHWKKLGHKDTCKPKPLLPKVLIIDILKEPTVLPKSFKKSITHRSTLITSNSVEDSIKQIQSVDNKLSSILIITPIPNSTSGEKLIKALVDYCQIGGRVLVGLGSPSSLTAPVSEKLFKSFGLSWKPNSLSTTSHLFYPSHPLYPTFTPSMLETYSMSAITLKGVEREDIVFASTEDQDVVGVAFGRVGKGFFGWVGDTSLVEGSRRITLALLGLECI